VGQKLTGINERSDAGQKFSALMTGQLFSIKRVEELLNEAIGHLGGEIGLRNGIAEEWIGQCGHGTGSRIGG